MKRNSAPNLRRAFTLVEASIAICIFAAGALATGGSVAAIRTIRQNAMTKQALSSERTTDQEIAALGYAPENLTTHPLQPVASITTATNLSALTLNRAGSSQIAGISASLASANGANPARASAMGLQISTAASAVAVTVLAPPSFGLPDNATPSTFPIAGLIVPASNPPGTYVVFSDDGTATNSSSTKWANQTFDITSFPKITRAQAHSAFPQLYGASAVATLNLNYPLPVLTQDRQDGTTSFSWSLQQLLFSQNGGRTTWTQATAYTGALSYTVSGRNVTLTNGGVYWPAWTDFGNALSGPFQVTLTPTNPRFASSVQQYSFTYTGTQFLPSAPSGL